MIARGRDGRRQPEAIRDRTDPRTLERQGRRQSHKKSRAKATLHQTAGKRKLAEGDLGHHGRGVNQGGFHNRQNDDREPAQGGQDEESHAVNTSLL